MSTVPPAIADAYDAERFRAEGHRVIDMLADALARWHRREGAVLPWRAPEEARRAWAEIGRGELVDSLERAVAASTGLHHPRYMGHQVPPPLPAAALAELVSALLNQGTGVYEMGPSAAPIELAVVDWMCRTMGYGVGAGGALTSGGSLGNLTALLAMRQARAGYDAWHGGTQKPLAVITSADAHYSVARAVRVMGWGDAGVITVPVDAHHRMRASAVQAALDSRVIGIVAAAGSTATGAYDPLEELADLADKHGLWLHVDAAHGGGAALSQRHKGKLAGIARADSIVWDAHKLMMMPALVTGVLFKQGGHTYEAFAQQASYLFAGGAPAETWWDLGQRTLECTKRMMAVEVWSALRVQGEAWFGQVIDRVCELAALLAAKIEASGDFELAVAPESNIVCFRHKTADNRALRKKAIEGGRFYLVGTELAGSYHLRTTLMNPLTEPSDLDELLEYLRCLA